jgi:uncharacterized protein (DUF3820 family)
MKGTKPGEQRDIVLTFGKHKGELLADVPNGYLDWLSDQEFVEEKYSDLFQQVKIERAYREQHGIKIE